MTFGKEESVGISRSLHGSIIMNGRESLLLPCCLGFAYQLPASIIRLLDIERAVSLHPLFVGNGVLLTVLVGLMVVSLQVGQFNAISQQG